MRNIESLEELTFSLEIFSQSLPKGTFVLEVLVTYAEFFALGSPISITVAGKNVFIRPYADRNVIVSFEEST